jgi:hypothetical protein
MEKYMRGIICLVMVDMEVDMEAKVAPRQVIKKRRKID